MACPGSSGGKQGGRRWPSVCRRASATRAAYWRKEDDRGGVEMGWAVLGQVSGRQVTSFSLSLLFLFCFILLNLFCHCLNFKIIQTMPVTPLNIFMLLDGIFQKHIKCFRVFGNIFYISYEYGSKCK